MSKFQNKSDAMISKLFRNSESDGNFEISKFNREKYSFLLVFENELTGVSLSRKLVGCFKGWSDKCPIDDFIIGDDPKCFHLEFLKLPCQFETQNAQNLRPNETPSNAPKNDRKYRRKSKKVSICKLSKWQKKFGFILHKKSSKK